MAIKFGSEVYTWFMDGYGEGNDNKLPHMAKIIGEAGFAGIEPMVLEQPLHVPSIQQNGSSQRSVLE